MGGNDVIRPTLDPDPEGRGGKAFCDDVSDDVIIVVTSPTPTAVTGVTTVYA